jgi:hypothetical protein
MLQEKLVKLLNQSFGLQLLDSWVEVGLDFALDHREHVANEHLDFVVLRSSCWESSQNFPEVAVINL